LLGVQQRLLVRLFALGDVVTTMLANAATALLLMPVRLAPVPSMTCSMPCERRSRATRRMAVCDRICRSSSRASSDAFWMGWGQRNSAL
jgi:hypothetical protein